MNHDVFQVASQLLEDIRSKKLAFRAGPKTILEASMDECLELLEQKEAQFGADTVGHASSKFAYSSWCCVAMHMSLGQP